MTTQRSLAFCRKTGSGTTYAASSCGVCVCLAKNSPSAKTQQRFLAEGGESQNGEGGAGSRTSGREGHPVCTSEALRARKIGEDPYRSPQGILDAAGDSPPSPMAWEWPPQSNQPKMSSSSFAETIVGDGFAYSATLVRKNVNSLSVSLCCLGSHSSSRVPRTTSISVRLGLPES